MSKPIRSNLAPRLAGLWLLLNGFLGKQVQPPFKALASLLIRWLVAVPHNQIHGRGAVTGAQGVVQRFLNQAVRGKPGNGLPVQGRDLLPTCGIL
jgi:hypothetical protein